ncbi:MAG TPA: thioredoxin family protein [Bacteroidia bacterium]|nr:thioredoxin family protein [Bacteroidia bacterium]
MKRNYVIFTIIFSLFLNSFIAKAQQDLPSVMVTDFESQRKNIRDVIDSSKTTLLICWAVWSHISQKQIENLTDFKEELNTKYHTEIVLINMDDSRNSSRIKPMISGMNWSFPCFLDLNADLKRALNITNIPSTIIVGPSLKVIWSKVGYYDGDEETIIEKIKELNTNK